jgi:hypothetical protein
MYEQSVDQLRVNAPAQYDFIRGMFINPQTGARPATPFGQGGSIYPPEPAAAASAAAAAAQAAPASNVTQSQIDAMRERQMGLTPAMKARGMTIADVWGP